MTDLAEQDAGDARWNYLAPYVGANWPRFAATAAAVHAGGFGVSWSWPAFLVPEFWFAYRRRHLWAAVLLLFGIIACLGPDVGVDILLAVRVLMGLFGKSLYLRHGFTRIDKILAEVPDEPERLRRIERAGETSFTGVIVLAAVILALIGAGAWAILSDSSLQAMP